MLVSCLAGLDAVLGMGIYVLVCFFFCVGYAQDKAVGIGRVEKRQTLAFAVTRSTKIESILILDAYVCQSLVFLF